MMWWGESSYSFLRFVMGILGESTFELLLLSLMLMFIVIYTGFQVDVDVVEKSGGLQFHGLQNIQKIYFYIRFNCHF
jgi:hypothetical protein